MGQPVVLFEIGCQDSPKTTSFFSDLFGWTIERRGPATLIDTGAGRGIVGHLTSLPNGLRNYVTIYVQVDDLDAYLEKARELGGETVEPPNEVPGAGKFAWLNDPEGNMIGIWQPYFTG